MHHGDKNITPFKVINVEIFILIYRIYYAFIKTCTFLSLLYIRISIGLDILIAFLFNVSSWCLTLAIIEYEIIPWMLLRSSVNASFAESTLLNSAQTSSYVFPSPTRRNGDNRSSLIFLKAFHFSTSLTSSISICCLTLMNDCTKGCVFDLKVISTG